MPGLTLRLTSGNQIFDERETARAQSILLHGAHYKTHSIVVRPRLHLGWVTYDEYPVQVFSESGYLIYLEGRVYNRSAAAVEADLWALAREAFGPKRDESGIERFILSNEGSFIVAAVCPDTDEALIFSDAFCRLPLYYSADSSGLIVAREAKFVHALRPEATLDRIGCAQVLAFGLPLGDRTVLEGVKSFPDAGLLRARVADGCLDWNVRVLHKWNLDDESRSTTPAKHAEEFAHLFLRASQNWGTHPDSGGNIVSLSGGHDSRAVAAGMLRSGTSIVTVTYRDPNGKRDREIECARQLTHALGAEWHCINLPTATESSYEELAWLKDGMNWSSMGYILSYLEEIVTRWGRDWTYLSGDGGDDCLKVTAPRSHFRETSDLIQYILQKETCVSPDSAEALLRLPDGTLRDELVRLFESYPEMELSRRIKHFKIFERGRRCYFEGEDRTRSFLWQDSPFYSLALFRHCMRIPDREKHYNAFCRRALLALSPSACNTPTTSSGYPPVSWRYILYHWAKETTLNLPQPLVGLARRLSRRSREASYVVPDARSAYLYDQLTQDTPLAYLFDAGQLSQALLNTDEHSFSCLWTVAMLEKAYRSRMG